MENSPKEADRPAVPPPPPHFPLFFPNFSLDTSPAFGQFFFHKSNLFTSPPRQQGRVMPLLARRAGKKFVT